MKAPLTAYFPTPIEGRSFAPHGFAALLTRAGRGSPACCALRGLIFDSGNERRA